MWLIRFLVLLPLLAFAESRLAVLQRDILRLEKEQTRLNQEIVDVGEHLKRSSERVRSLTKTEMILKNEIAALAAQESASHGRIMRLGEVLAGKERESALAIGKVRYVRAIKDRQTLLESYLTYLSLSAAKGLTELRESRALEEQHRKTLADLTARKTIGLQELNNIVREHEIERQQQADLVRHAKEQQEKLRLNAAKLRAEQLRLKTVIASLR